MCADLPVGGLKEMVSFLLTQNEVLVQPAIDIDAGISPFEPVKERAE